MGCAKEWIPEGAFTATRSSLNNCKTTAYYRCVSLLILSGCKYPKYRYQVASLSKSHVQHSFLNVVLNRFLSASRLKLPAG
jgi:hypothetical protein